MEYQPDVGPGVRYWVVKLAVQRDGSTCGFWAIVIALLCMFNINVEDSQLIDRLKGIGISQLKELWKAVWTSWRVEEHGVGVRPVKELLSYFFDFSNECALKFEGLDEAAYVCKPRTWLQ